MEHMTFGIDLGTTNSGIAKYENGNVVVLKNPVGLKDTLPSVVSFKKGRILIGDKAREQYLSNAAYVFSTFKRKMGTDEVYKVIIDELDQEISPTSLSAHVLRELRGYRPESEVITAVITIPSSFDSVQSSATKSAGLEAGFREVVLLQEPIAACLAYANSANLNLVSEQKWLVYDFGGGTFDTALVHINNRELKILDNKGNNFLGGVDIDHLFLEAIIVPRVSVKLEDEGLWTKLSLKKGLYKKLWYYLLYLAEEAKMELSMSQSCLIEITFPEFDLDLDIEIKRDDFEQIVDGKYLETEAFIDELLDENNLSTDDIERIILVGGTTYIPYIRSKLNILFNGRVDDSLDPTTAVMVGAAYYAGSQPVALIPETDNVRKPESLAVSVTNEAYTNDLEELIAFKVLIPFKGYYRIRRKDGGFDSGLVSFEQKGREFVSLLPKRKNTFELKIFNADGLELFVQNDLSIEQGLYHVRGQLLPEDICIELDDSEVGTYLDVIFKRNSILPLSKTIYKSFSKSLTVGSSDRIAINVVEGKGGTLPGSNLSIGFIAVKGDMLTADLIEGTDIEIQVEMDESRGLTVQIYIPSLDQEITESFEITSRTVDIKKCLMDIQEAQLLIEKEIGASSEIEAYEHAGELKKMAAELGQICTAFNRIEHDNITEEKYRLDERKRKLLAKLDSFTRNRDLSREIKNYQEEKKIFAAQREHATTEQANVFLRLEQTEKEVLATGNKNLIQRKATELKELNDKIYLQKPENYIGIFLQLKLIPEEHYTDQHKRSELLDEGRKAVDAHHYEALKSVVYLLFSLLKPELRSSHATKINETNKSNHSKLGLQ